MGTNDNSKLFDAYYFAHGCGRPYQRDEEWLSFFDGIAEQIVKRINPKMVLDAGCAMGFLVEGLRMRGVEAYGIDVSEYAIQNVHEDIKDFCRLESISEPFAQQYDLIVVIEVLEHLRQTEAEKAVENICRFSDDVLFSSTPFDYKEATHFNVQPPEYWSELFARNLFFRDVDFDTSFITPWAVRYVRKHEPVHRVVRDYERKIWLLWKENSDLRELTLEIRTVLSSNENRLQELENQVQELQEARAEIELPLEETQNQLADVLNSRSWQLMQRFQRIRLRLIPQNSLREKLFLGILRSF